MTQEALFTDGDMVVYPAHGVGKLECVESQTIAGQELKVLVINFEKNRMTLRLPMMKARNAGLRSLSTKNDIETALLTLQKKARSTKGMIWARRAQEYELKINSGSITSIAEVLRELYRSENEPEQSYSERQIYKSALERLAAEIAAVESIAEDLAMAKVEELLRVA